MGLSVFLLAIENITSAFHGVLNFLLLNFLLSLQ